MSRTARYLPADKFITINDGDPFLTKIDIPCPEPPDLELIDGYGLDPYDQIFHRPKIPEAIIKIGQDFKNIDDKWLALENQRHNLKKEIEWLKKQIYYHVNGAWWFINGKPTFLPPAFYDSVAFHFTHTGNKPEYRERSRRLHLVMQWVENYTYDFKNKEYDSQGLRLPNKYGDELEDVGERTLMGMIHPKGRRMAATYNAIVFCLNKLHNTGKESYIGLQAQDGPHGKKLWQKFTTVWRTTPWWLMPYYDGDYSPETQIRYRRSQEFMGSFGLGNHIDWASNGSSGNYDGEELSCYIRDEAGKITEESWDIEWDRAKKTLAWSEGKVINGVAFCPSTAGEFSKKGGKAFLNMIKGSDYYQRTESGRTETGLIVYWESSAYGSPGFLDRFGDSVHEKAKKFYLGERTHLIQQNTPDSLRLLHEKMRNTPLYLMECFVRSESGIGFNQIILDKRIAELNFRKQPPRYNLEWRHGFGSEVEAVENSHGRFINFTLLPSDKTNKKYSSNGHWYPQYPSFAMHGSDTFNFSETEGRRKSLGGLIGIKRRISYLEDKDEDIKLWRTPDILYTYANRTATVEDYAEDCLKVCIYYSGLINPESNNPHVRQYFKRHNFGGYLYYYRKEDGSFNETPGYSKTTNTGNIHMTHATKFIEKFGHRLNHIELLKQCKEFQGVEDLTNLDLLSAFGAALDAIENDFRSSELSPFSNQITYRELFGQR